MIRFISNRTLLAFLIAADLAIFGGGAWLTKYSFSVAADPRSSALLILALLLANLVLLVLLFVAITAGGVVATRLAAQAIARFSDKRHRAIYDATSNPLAQCDRRMLAAERRAPGNLRFSGLLLRRRSPSRAR
ncbi:MAG TPA: hypothetical protein VJP85_13510 [Candidatus Baltobacteraceae bacterium]|nr:hypothetical protein [Candidatus Baltobacteraceae bacterium]